MFSQIKVTPHRHWYFHFHRNNSNRRDSSSLVVRCSKKDYSSTPYEILGVEPSCSFQQLKAAFRSRVKEFHPDVAKPEQDVMKFDVMIRRVIHAYQFLLKHHTTPQVSQREDVDPFEEPECEAFDVFVNELLCIGKVCSYSCVKRAPHAFSFTAENGTARAISQGHGDDYEVQIAAGRCPRKCIHYVTPTQRAILEDLLNSILEAPYDPAEMAFLDSLIRKATYQNYRYQKPAKPKPEGSTEFVDWY